MKLNLGSGRFPLDGFVNVDDNPDWHPDVLRDLNRGLPYSTASVDAVTISHVLMYFARDDRRFILSEAHRVLTPGGWLRVTEDDTEHELSGRRGIQPGAVSFTSPARAMNDLRRAGFRMILGPPPDVTFSGDPTLIQRFHGDPPDVFHIEAQKAP